MTGRRLPSPEHEGFDMAMTRRERLAQMRRMAVQLEVTNDPVEMVRLSRALLVAATEHRDIALNRANARHATVSPRPVSPTAEPASPSPGV